MIITAHCFLVHGLLHAGCPGTRKIYHLKETQLLLPGAGLLATSLHIVLVACSGFLVARAGACDLSECVGFLLNLRAHLTTYLTQRYKHRLSEVLNKNADFVYSRRGTIYQAVRSRKTYSPDYSFLFCTLCIVCNSPPVSYQLSGGRWHLKAQ